MVWAAGPPSPAEESPAGSIEGGGGGGRPAGHRVAIGICGGRVQGAGCRVQGAGCRVQGAGCRVQGANAG